MMDKQKRSITKTIIIVLAVLLALSVVALAGTLIYNQINGNEQTTVTVPENLITPEKNPNGGEEAEPGKENPVPNRLFFIDLARYTAGRPRKLTETVFSPS